MNGFHYLTQLVRSFFRKIKDACFKFPPKSFINICILLITAFSLIMLSLSCFQKKQVTQHLSGIEGQILHSVTALPLNQNSKVKLIPVKSLLQILDTDRELIKEIKTDKNGRFKVDLKAGKYFLRAIVPEPGDPSFGKEQVVVVKPMKITEVVIQVETGIKSHKTGHE